MTLVDTSAWVAFFRGSHPLATSVDQLLDGGEAALCGPVITELRRGLRNAADRRRVLPLLDGCHMLPQPDALWEEVGDLGFALARRGIAVRTLDLLIATFALSAETRLLTADSDFQLMVDAGIPLRLLGR